MAEPVNLAADADPALDDVVIVGRFAGTETGSAGLAGCTTVILKPRGG
jgi:hypothetical protein